LATRYNNRKIILSEQTLPTGKLLSGMIVTFNYSVEGVTDPRPILLFLHRDGEKKLIEGLNMNYINPAKIKKFIMNHLKMLLSVIEKRYLRSIKS